MSSPLYERTAGNYGSAPYEESAFRTALRILGGAARGAVAAPGQGGVLGGFFTGFDASARASDEARRAAEAYAMKQQEAEDNRIFKQRQQDLWEEQINASRRPPEKDPRPWQYREKFRDDPLAKELVDKDLMRGRFTPKEKALKPDRTEILDLNTVIDNFRQDKDVQNFGVVRDNARRIKGALNQGTGYGDLAAIFAFMRVLDPISVVRETEFANAEAASGWLQRTLNLPEKAVQGNRLTPLARKKINAMTESLYRTQKQTYDRKVEQYRRISKKVGVDPALVIPDYGDDAAPPGGGVGGADLIYDPTTGNLVPAR
jgi:hypothetical protein